MIKGAKHFLSPPISSACSQGAYISVADMSNSCCDIPSFPVFRILFKSPVNSCHVAKRLVWCQYVKVLQRNGLPSCLASFSERICLRVMVEPCWMSKVKNKHCKQSKYSWAWSDNVLVQLSQGFEEVSRRRSRKDFVKLQNGPEIHNILRPRDNILRLR